MPSATGIRLLSDCVAIRPDPQVEKRHGLIVIPASADNPADRGYIEEGTVVYVGPGDRYFEKLQHNSSVRRWLFKKDGSPVPAPCKAGDRVMYVAGRAGHWVEVDGERLYVVHCEQFVIAVLEPDEVAA